MPCPLLLNISCHHLNFGKGHQEYKCFTNMDMLQHFCTLFADYQSKQKLSRNSILSLLWILYCLLTSIFFWSFVCPHSCWKPLLFILLLYSIHTTYTVTYGQHMFSISTSKQWKSLLYHILGPQRECNLLWFWCCMIKVLDDDDDDCYFTPLMLCKNKFDSKS